MRTFKIAIITLLLIVLAGMALWAIKGLLPAGFGPDDEFESHYDEHDHEHEMADDLYSQQLKQYEGVVKPIGVSIYQEGSHRLEADDSLVALLESEDIILADFEGDEVKVRGMVRDTVEGGQKIMTVKSIEKIDQAGSVYFSEVGYEFGFAYPSDWEVKKEQDKVTFWTGSGDDAQNLVIVYQFEDEKKSLDDWLKDRDQNLLFDEEQVSVGDNSGVRRTIKNGEDEILKTYVQAGKNIYEIRLLSQDDDVRHHYFAIVDFFKTSFSSDEEVPEEESEEENQEADEETEPDTEEEAEEEPDTEEEEPAAEEDQAASSDDESSDEEGQSFSSLEPLSSGDIERVMEKGFSPFEGRTLTFDFPKIWHFEYIGDSTYGFTDDSSFKENGEEISQDVSRILLIGGKVEVSCSYQAKAERDNTNYTVCAREPGLKDIADHIAGSIK